MKKYLNICNIYILLWCIYYLQGIVYASGGMISKMVLLLLMLISGYYFIEVNIRYRIPSFLKVLNIFIGVMTIYGIILLLDPLPLISPYTTHQVSKLEFIKSLYISLLPIYSMFAFTKQNLLRVDVIQILTIILIISTTLLYYRTEQELLQKAANIGSMQEEFTNNTGYNFLQLFPLLFFWNKRPIFQYTLVAYIFVFIVMSMKRGAILVGAACLLWFIYRVYKSSSKNNRTLILILTIIAISIGTIYIKDFYSSNNYFQYRIEQTIEGNSSGRDNLYGKLWDHFINQDSLLHVLFGNGASKTVIIAGNYAHSDWLEILTCQGLFGIILYIIYYISIFKLFRQSSHNSLIYSILGMCLFIMFTSSIFSMSYNSLSLSITLCLGYCLATQKNKHEKNNLSY